MWNEVEEQGIDSEDVARFALKSEFMTAAQKRDMQAMKFAKGGKPIVEPDGRQVCHPTHANCVILKTGEVVPLDPWVWLP